MVGGDLLSVQEIADRLGWTLDVTRKRLHALHAKHGGLLFRNTGELRQGEKVSRTKLWVDPAALQRIMPDRFGGNLSVDDVMGLLEKVEEVDRKASRALAEIAEFRRKAKQWFSMTPRDVKPRS